jgi:hypothetical protein
MSIIICQYCGKHIDTDFDVEHEDVCKIDREEKYGEQIPSQDR